MSNANTARGMAEDAKDTARDMAKDAKEMAENEIASLRAKVEQLMAERVNQALSGLADRAEGVRIFIGSENKLFSLSGSSLIVAPFQDKSRKIVGVLGVIGPTRLNYARIIPMVDYTARLVGRLLT